MNEPRPSWNTPTKLIVVLIILVVAGYMLFRFREVLPPLVLALILAFILVPLADFFQKRLHMNRALAIVLIYLLLLLVGTGILMLVIPLLIHQFSGFTINLENIFAQARDLFAGQIEIAGVVVKGQDVYQQVIKALEGLAEPLFGTTLNVVSTLLSSIVWLIFILIVSFYLIKDSTKVVGWLERLAPPAYRPDVARMREDLTVIWSAFFRGQILLALVVMVIISVEGLIIGLPFSLVMGVLAGLLEFLPSIGHGIWLVLAGTLAISFGSTWLPIPPWAFLLILLFLHLLYTQFDLNYLIPRIIGRSVHLPPLVIILGIVAGAALAGVLGVVLAAPTIASLRVIGRYIYARLADQEPFPEFYAFHPLPPPSMRWWKKWRGRRVMPSKHDREDDNS
jgi:predicted PurR-regulated permease PerM